MTNPDAGRRPVNFLRSLSPIWIVPIAALLIALGLGFRAWEQRGETVEIIFDNASGIEVGQTRVRLKDVEVGKVTSLKLTPDLRQVRVTVELDKSVSRHLSSNTRFWVVTPRISATGISNVGTLISGVYIVMDPGEPGEDQSVFVGLSEPPAIGSHEEGHSFVLLADELGSLDIGAPVYYRQFKVGEVTSYHLAPSGDYVAVNIFVPAPYDRLVQTRSRFWNVSGFGFSVGAEGVKAKMASLASLISGGVAFDNSVGFEGAETAPDGHRFVLYEDRDSVLDGRYSLKHYYLLRFGGSVRGLSVGAPVEFRGITIGEVIDISLDDIHKDTKSLHVYIAIQPQRLYPEREPTRQETDALIAGMVEQGLRARLKTGSLLTGSRYVDLSFSDEPVGELVRRDNYSIIPTEDDSLDAMGRELAAVVDKLNKVPFDAIGQDLASSLASLKMLLNQLEQQKTAQKLDNALGHVEGASAGLDKTLQTADETLLQMRETLKTLDRTLAPDSELHYELLEALKAVEKAAESFGLFSDELNRYPNSLIHGVEKE
jgi:paraquat-inducible protein B